MTKKQIQKENILRHGLALQRIFPATKDMGPVDLCKTLHRIETKLHRQFENQCNGYWKGRIIDDQAYIEMDKADAKMLNRVYSILNATEGQKKAIFINRDPRGYALKIKSEFVNKKKLDIHRDMGGYGILCPEF